MDSIINDIERLVDNLYASNNNNGDQKNAFTEANCSLMNAQNSKEAWSFVWPLLEKERSVNVQYFGANTLYLKLSKHFYELDLNHHVEYRLQIIKYLMSYLTYPDSNVVTTKLISCLGAFVIQTIDSSWPSALPDIINSIQPEKLPHLPPSRVIYVLLQILVAIPDEYKSLHIDKTKKVKVSLELQNHAQMVMYFLQKVLSDDNISDNITQIYVKCFASWTKGLGTLILSDNHSNIISMILNAVCNENTCHEASEALIEIYTSPYMEKYPKLVLQIIEQMTNGLEVVLFKALSESKQDFCQELYLLFIEIAGAHTRLLLDTLIDTPEYTNVILKLLQIILQCSNTSGCFGYDEFISDQPFNFWITFQDDIMASDTGKIQIYLSLFNEIYDSLINCFLVKVQYPSDEIYIYEWDNDDREKFRCYRQDIGDTFMYCYNILRSSMLKSLFSHFNKAFDQVILFSQKESDYQALLSSARYLEAVLFAFHSIAENIDSQESVFLPQMFASFSSIPLNKINMPHLLETTMTLLSSFAEWISSNVQYIPYTISVISVALKSNSTSVVIAATMALKIITPECQLNLQPYAMQMIELCEEHLSYPNLQYKEKARLMFTLGTVLSIMPMEVIMQTVNRILIPILSETEKLICMLDDNNIDKVRIHITGILLVLANLFSKLDINLKGTELEEGDQLISKSLVEKSAKNDFKPQPIYIIFEKVLPLFGMIATKYSKDEEITENLCECIKKTVITLLDDVQPLVGNILQLLLHLYQSSKSTHVLKISRQLFTLFANVPQQLIHLQQYFTVIVQETIDVFQHDFRENTFLAQIFYEECAITLKKSPIIYSYEKLDLTSMFSFAISGIVLPEKSTIHQCTVFLSEFLNQGRNNEIFYRIITERFDFLILQIFTVIGGTVGSPSYAVDFMPDIIMTLNQKYSDSFSRSLNSVVDTENFPTNFATRDHKIAFVKSILSLRNNKRKMKDIVKEFSSRCRGLFGIDIKN